MIDATKVAEHFDQVADRFMAPMDDLVELCYPPVIQSIRDSFNSSASPDGMDWPARKNPGDGHPLEVESGDMMQAATGGGPGHVHTVETTGGGSDLCVGVSLDVIAYARAQALGYPPRNLPARNFLGLNQAGQEKVDQILGDGMERRFDGVATPGAVPVSA